MANRRTRYSIVLAVIGSIGLLACQPDLSDTPPKAGPVYVYSSYSDVDYLPRLFQQFTEETGIHVVVRHRSDAENLQDMQNKSGSQAADVLLTSSVWAAWLAAEEGLLRPLAQDSAVEENVPDFLRDTDNLWVGLSVDPIVISGTVPTASPVSYEELASPQYSGQLCVGSSTLSENRVLIAMLIETLGARNAELMIRRWMNNLARRPREKPADLFNDELSSVCKLSVSRLSTLRSSHRDVMHTETPVFFDIEALGIGRHAEHPEAAQELIDWLLRPAVNSMHARQRHLLPIDTSSQTLLPELTLSDVHVGIAGFRYEEAALLAERARYP